MKKILSHSTIAPVCLLVTALSASGLEQSPASPDPQTIALTLKVEALEPALASPGLAAEPENQTPGHLQLHGYRDFSNARPVFEKLPETNLSRMTNSSNLGDFDLFTIAKPGNQIGMVGEALFTWRFTNSSTWPARGKALVVMAPSSYPARVEMLKEVCGMSEADYVKYLARKSLGGDSSAPSLRATLDLR